MKKRIISAAIAIAILLPVFLIGGLLFKLAVAVIAGLGFYEILKLKKSHKKYPMYIKFLSILLLELVILNTVGKPVVFGLNYVTLALTVLVLLIPTIFTKKEEYDTKDAFYLIGTINLLGLVFHLMSTIFLDNKYCFLYLLLIAIVTDTFAMLGGLLIGKHKLIPSVSPKKSVEGSICGSVLGAILPSIFYYNVVTSDINIFILLIMTLILSILGQIGDLLFSKIKRENDIKDFSNIMPGHGGVLDRLDSSSFIFLGYIILEYLIKIII